MSHSRARQRALPSLQVEVLEDRSLLSVSPPTLLSFEGLSLDQATYDQTHILVRYHPNAEHQPSLPGTTVGRPVGFLSDLYCVELAPEISVEQALQAYRADPRVVLAEPDFLLSATQVPNDPLFNQQQNLDNSGQQGGLPGADIQAVPGWDVTTGTGSLIVSFMDTGVDYSHPDLYLNIAIDQQEIPLSRRVNLTDIDQDGRITFRDLNDVRNQGGGKITDLDGNGQIDGKDLLAPMVQDFEGRDTGFGGWADGLSPDGDAYVDDLIGWNFFDNTNDPFDNNGHGTHVTGILGARGNDGFGVAGIAWQTQVLPVKFLGPSGAGSVTQFLVGLEYALNQGARISNNSWTGALGSSVLQAALAEARDQGHIFVAAAGNEAVNSDLTPNYPSGFSLDNIVAVTASDDRDQLASFANYGPESVDLAAPGVQVLSTIPGGGHARLTGTSMATPHVTGALALVWSQHPDWTFRQVIDHVLSTVDPLPAFEGKVVSGGRLNLARALGSPDQGIGSGPRVIDSNLVGVNGSEFDRLRLVFDGAIDVGTFSIEDVQLLGPGSRDLPAQAVQAVPESGNTTFEILVPVQNEAGVYTLTLGADIRDPQGRLIVPFEMSYSFVPVHTFTHSEADPVRAQQTAVSLLNIEEDIAIGDLDVQLNIRHPFTRDLRIFLQAPNGASVVLVDRSTGRGDDFRDTVFDDEASLSIKEGTGPYEGPYRPEVSLAHLDGIRSPGLWKLWIENSGPADGLLNGWSLIITPKVDAPPPEPEPEPPPPSPPPLTRSVTVEQALADGSRSVSLLRVDQQVPIDHLVVGLTVNHPRVSDLHVLLQGPVGTAVVLVDQGEASGDNLAGAYFDDNSDLALAGSPPVPATFRPSVPLSSFTGQNTLGYWKLWVEDRVTGQAGVLVGWSLIVNPEGAPSVGSGDAGEEEEDDQVFPGVMPNDLLPVVQSADKGEQQTDLAHALEEWGGGVSEEREG
jgi:serine protease